MMGSCRILVLLFALPLAFSRQLSVPRVKEGVRDCRNEQFRPQLHFSAEKNWLNDPNGLVYYQGEYHLHYQYDPYSVNGGPKHWAHAVSTDLMHWTDIQIALYPDELGDMWSGSAVVDYDNTTGFQVDPEVSPIVAIFTHALGPPGQVQSIAYSLNKARDFVKYPGNPVIPNPGVNDFRDPKVTYHNGRWYLVLAAGNKAEFYGSDNLRDWEYLSAFGVDPDQGAHGGAWECPDFFTMELDGFLHWVLTVSISGGGPNGGSTTQYFLGSFDGHTFKSSQIEPLWTDWGMDNYAGVTFFGLPGRTVSIGWMSNLAYAGREPTGDYRGQLTLPRSHSLVRTEQQEIRFKSMVVDEISVLRNPAQHFTYNDFRLLEAGAFWRISDEFGFENPLMEVDLAFNLEGIVGSSSLSICFLNEEDQELCVGYDNERDAGHEIFLNRERAGDWSNSVASRPTSGRLTNDKIISFKIIQDVSAIELFVDGGLTVMTTLFFPLSPMTGLEIRHHATGGPTSEILLLSASVRGLNSMYDC